jgi:hypothetical protein
MGFFKNFIKDSLSGDPMSAYSNLGKNIKSAIENKMAVQEKPTPQPATLIENHLPTDTKLETEYKEKLIQFAIIKKDRFVDEGNSLFATVVTLGFAGAPRMSNKSNVKRTLDENNLRKLSFYEIFNGITLYIITLFFIFRILVHFIKMAQIFKLVF